MKRAYNHISNSISSSSNDLDINITDSKNTHQYPNIYNIINDSIHHLQVTLNNDILKKSKSKADLFHMNIKGMFLSQLYVIVDNNTYVDQEISKLRDNDVIKCISCEPYQNSNGFFIILTSDYLNDLLNPLNDQELSINETRTIFSKILSLTAFRSKISFLKADLLNTVVVNLIGNISRDITDVNDVNRSSNSCSNENRSLSNEDLDILIREG